MGSCICDWMSACNCTGFSAVNEQEGAGGCCWARGAVLWLSSGAHFPILKVGATSHCAMFALCGISKIFS